MAVRTQLGGGLLLAVLFAAGAAAAAPEEDPATVYDRGASAYDRGDFPTAAKELAHADELAPNAITLELALNAALRTDDAVLAMTLAERAEGRPGSKTLDALAQSARKKLASRIGRLDVLCAAGTSCEVTLDGAPFAPGAPRIVAIGPHRVAVTRGPALERFDVTIEPGKQVEVIAGSQATTSAPAPPEAASIAVVERPHSLSPVWFWLGLGLTVAAGGGAIASGVDTIAKHNTFSADRSNADAAADGRSAETRTVVLLATTGALALGTAVLGIFFVDLGGRRSTGLSF